MAAPVEYLDKVKTVADDELVSFDDFDRRRSLILDSVKTAVKQRFPLGNDRYTLEVEDLGYDDPERAFTVKDQKQAIVEGKTLTKPLKGRFVLRDAATGKVLERGAKRVLMHVPYLTPRGTFIRNGNESVVLNQMRMIPGVYSKKMDDGVLEAFVNVKQGTGTQFKLRFDPTTALFHFKAGGRKIPALPVLKAMGVDEKDLEQAWGQDILNKNRAVNHDLALKAAYEVFVPKYERQADGD